MKRLAHPKINLSLTLNLQVLCHTEAVRGPLQIRAVFQIFLTTATVAWSHLGNMGTGSGKKHQHFLSNVTLPVNGSACSPQGLLAAWVYKLWCSYNWMLPILKKCLPIFPRHCFFVCFFITHHLFCSSCPIQNPLKLIYTSLAHLINYLLISCREGYY